MTTTARKRLIGRVPTGRMAMLGRPLGCHPGGPAPVPAWGRSMTCSDRPVEIPPQLLAVIEAYRACELSNIGKTERPSPGRR